MLQTINGQRSSLQHWIWLMYLNPLASVSNFFLPFSLQKSKPHFAFYQSAVLEDLGPPSMSFVDFLPISERQFDIFRVLGYLIFGHHCYSDLVRWVASGNRSFQPSFSSISSTRKSCFIAGVPRLRRPLSSFCFSITQVEIQALFRPTSNFLEFLIIIHRFYAGD